MKTMISDRARAAVWFALLLIAFPIAVFGDCIVMAYEKSLVGKMGAVVKALRVRFCKNFGYIDGDLGY